MKLNKQITSTKFCSVGDIYLITTKHSRFYWLCLGIRKDPENGKLWYMGRDSCTLDTDEYRKDAVLFHVFATGYKYHILIDDDLIRNFDEIEFLKVDHRFIMTLSAKQMADYRNYQNFCDADKEYEIYTPKKED